MRESEGGARASQRASYGLGTLAGDRALMYVSRWCAGEQTTVAILPVSEHNEERARAFCAAQNQAPDKQRERAFVRWAGALLDLYNEKQRARRARARAG